MHPGGLGVGVAGSNPVTPTIDFNRLFFVKCSGTSANCLICAFTKSPRIRRDYTKSLPPAQAWHENWADYSDDDKRPVLGEVSALVRKQMYMA
jgi:hypothetical protein